MRPDRPTVRRRRRGRGETAQQVGPPAALDELRLDRGEQTATLAGVAEPLRAGFGECVDQVRAVIVARLEVGAALDEHRDAERVE